MTAPTLSGTSPLAQAMGYTPGDGDAPLMGWDDFMAVADPSYLIDGVVHRDALAAVIGKYGHYKSYLSLAWNLSIATGRPWLGHQVLAPGPAIYVMAESPAGMRARAEAWAIREGLKRVDNFHVRTVALHMLEPLHVERFIERVGNTVAALAVEPAVIWLDTLSKMIPGRDENSQKEMSLLVAAGEKLRESFAGCLVGFSHHDNAAGVMRGSTTLPAGFNDIWHMDRNEDTDITTLHCVRLKDDEEPEDQDLKWERVELPDGPNGPRKANGVLVAVDRKEKTERWWKMVEEIVYCVGGHNRQHDAEKKYIGCPSVHVERTVTGKATEIRDGIKYLVREGRLEDKASGVQAKYRVRPVDPNSKY